MLWLRRVGLGQMRHYPTVTVDFNEHSMISSTGKDRVRYSAIAIGIDHA
jgi:hypothetical protein